MFAYLLHDLIYMPEQRSKQQIPADVLEQLIVIFNMIPMMWMNNY